MKDGLKKCIHLTVFAAVFLIALTVVYRVLSWKDTMGEYLSSVRALYATENDLIDVLFVGSSHCYAGINPDVLWRDYGIAGFDMAISGQDRSAADHYIREALKTQSPRVVAVDLLATLYDEGLVSNAYRSMLPMKTGLNQLQMVLAETKDPSARADYLLKWPVIHGRYRELAAYDFRENPVNTYGRGYCYRFASVPVDYHPEVHESREAVPVSEANRAWVDGLHALSQKEGFALVFLQIPHEMEMSEKEIYNGVIEYIRGQDVPVLEENVLYGGAELNIGWDFMDAGHLNAGGGEKLSDYLGGWLKEEYALPDRRGDERYWQWDESLTYAEHLYLSEELSASEDCDGVFASIEGKDGLVILIRTEDPEDADSAFCDAAGRAGISPEWFSVPGVVASCDGRIAGAVRSDSADPFLMDVDAVHSLAAVCNKTAYADNDASDNGAGVTFSVLCDGEECLEAHDGISVAVYDIRLGKIVKTIYK